MAKAGGIEPIAFRHDFPPKPMGAATILTLCGVCGVGLGAIIWVGLQNDKQSEKMREASRERERGGREV